MYMKGILFWIKLYFQSQLNLKKHSFDLSKFNVLNHKGLQQSNSQKHYYK